jgi:3-oxoacyl-[acyl-carrier-protein] synthase II
VTCAVGVAFGASSPLGEGEQALSACELGTPPTVAVVDDAALAAAGLARFAAARVPWLTPGPDAAERLLARSLGACVAELDRIAPSWKSLRVGLALGTSSGGMPAAERSFALLARGLDVPAELARASFYASPFVAAGASLGLPLARQAHVLAACASSTVALGLARIWLEQGACDLVLAGGYDALTTFVASGFSALGAVTASRPSPFRLGRDGLGLGEASAVVALVRETDAPRLAPGATPCLRVAGFGAASDATHITAPDRTGAGLLAAATTALAAAHARPDEVDLVSAHGTATVFNDAAEARALGALLGPRAAAVPTHAMKGETGHLFGAAGVLEALCAHRAMQRGVAPGSAGEGPVDPDALAAVAPDTRAHPAALALKLSLAFGGLNAALVLRAAPAALAEAPGRPALPGGPAQPGGPPRPGGHALPRPATAGAAGLVVPSGTTLSPELGVGDPAGSIAALAAALGASPDRLARVDALTRLALGAVADLARQLGRDAVASAALVVGHDLANIATNALYARRLIERGGRAVEARRFPYTSPNACAGEISIAFGIRGPTLAVGGGPGLRSQALEVARDLCSSRLAQACVVVEIVERSDVGDALLAALGRAQGPAGDAPPSFAFARLLRATTA